MDQTLHRTSIAPSILLVLAGCASVGPSVIPTQPISIDGYTLELNDFVEPNTRGEAKYFWLEPPKWGEISTDLRQARSNSDMAELQRNPYSFGRTSLNKPLVRVRRDRSHDCWAKVVAVHQASTGKEDDRDQLLTSKVAGADFGDLYTDERRVACANFATAVSDYVPGAVPEAPAAAPPPQ